MTTAAVTKTAAAKTEKPAKPERERKNGQTRPLAGTLTGTVWEIADAITTAQKKAPATREQVSVKYKEKVGADASDGTINTQYSRWVAFNGHQDALKEQRAKVREANAKAKADEKNAAAKAKADEKAAKEKAKADADKAKADAAAKAKETKTKAKTPPADAGKGDDVDKVING